ncbi:g673 [Coccomyxa viridis]|uniref:G673 protein n=1 Tax=Coccomyxa viridis TaxID=1274662 RepID=A0ABP1FN30_9CHLO
MASGAFVGAIFGFTVALYSNAVRKLPVFQAPWEHVVYAGIGAYAGNKVVEYTDRTAAEVDEMIKERQERNKVLREP